MAAQLREAGANVVDLGIVSDDKAALISRINKGLSCDFLITSGGISTGEYDLMKEALVECGATRLIFKVAMRPGKPFSFFEHGNAKIFALPGNPVSCMVSFEMFARPALLKAAGATDIFRRVVNAKLLCDLKKETGYKLLFRGIIKGSEGSYVVGVAGAQGSGILSSMSLANCLIIAGKDEDILQKGDIVKVIVTDDRFGYSRKHNVSSN